MSKRSKRFLIGSVLVVVLWSLLVLAIYYTKSATMHAENMIKSLEVLEAEIQSRSESVQELARVVEEIHKEEEDGFDGSRQ